MRFLDDIHKSTITPWEDSQSIIVGDRHPDHPNLIQVVPDSFIKIVRNRVVDVLLLRLNNGMNLCFMLLGFSFCILFVR